MQLTTEWDFMKKGFVEEMNKFAQDVELENLKQQASNLTTEKNTLQEEVNKFAKKTLTFFVDLHNQVTKDIREMEEIRATVVRTTLQSNIHNETLLMDKLKALAIQQTEKKSDE